MPSRLGSQAHLSGPKHPCSAGAWGAGERGLDGALGGGLGLPAEPRGQGARPWVMAPKGRVWASYKGSLGCTPTPWRRGGSWAPRNFPSLPRNQWPLK